MSPLFPLHSQLPRLNAPRVSTTGALLDCSLLHHRPQLLSRWLLKHHPTSLPLATSLAAACIPATASAHAAAFSDTAPAATPSSVRATA
jgi:hypothetical protein